MEEARKHNILENFNLKEINLLKRGMAMGSSHGIINCTINEYSDFDYLISEVGKTNLSILPSVQRYFRGVTNKDYDLLCGLSVNEVEEYEIELIQSLYSASPNMFSQCKSDFEMIALMQHYGLPTRFLDFTKNPLVALWFSCQENGKAECDTDGAVYVAIGHGTLPKSVIEIICKIAQNHTNLNTLCGLEKFLSAEEIKQYIMHIYACPYRMNFVSPPNIDLRETNQQSIFLVGLSKLYLVEELSDSGSYQQAKTLVTEDNYYGVLENFNEEYASLVPVGLQCYGEEDTEYILKLIIPAHKKKELLKELSCRGITEDFIYPTLEMTAKRIKNDIIALKDESLAKEKAFCEYLRQYTDKKAIDQLQSKSIE